MKLGARIQTPEPAVPKVARAWSLRDSGVGAVELAAELDVDLLVARLLAHRGVRDPALARLWLDGALRDLPDPLGMTGMQAAVDRIVLALQGGESVCVHGDYDVDGCTSTALLVHLLRRLGGRVTWYAPHRVRDGYGIADHTVERLAGEGVRLLITCDTGVSAHSAIELGNTHGIDTVVCDHHTLPPELPPAAAILNPKQDGEGNPYEELAAVGVAFMLAVALRSRLRAQGFFGDRREPDLREYLDIVALGTVADLAPLRGVNRLLVTTGLKVLAARRRVGLRALLDVAGLGDSPTLEAADLGFRLGPRINAAGRLDEAGKAVELLLSDDERGALKWAGDLDAFNRQRQQLERDIFAEALRQAGGLPDLAERRGVVVWSDRWHPGVVGIVASRLMHHLHKPILVVAVRDGVGTGSGRAIKGVDLYGALQRCEHLLQRWGGHRAAAGVTLAEADLPTLRDAFAGPAFHADDDELWNPQLMADAELPLSECTWETWERVQRLGPYGIGNPEPVFIARDLRPTDARAMNRGGLRVKLRQEGSPVLQAVGFGLDLDAENLSGPLEAAFSLQENLWRGRRSLELRLRALRPQDQD